MFINITLFKNKLFYLSLPRLKSLFIFMFTLLSTGALMSQTDSTAVVKKDTFNRKREIAYDGKRYRVYNNWLSFGGGAGFNTKWQHDEKDEKNLAIDYSFHIKQYYFRTGAFMSGRDFTAANNYNFHVGLGLRKESEKYNLSAFIGPSFSYFRRPLSDSTQFGLSPVLNTVYNRVGGYACLEAVYKIKYDVGLGGQIFCDYNEIQMVYGVRLIVYFSGSYRGIKYGYKKPKPKK